MRFSAQKKTYQFVVCRCLGKFGHASDSHFLVNELGEFLLCAHSVCQSRMLKHLSQRVQIGVLGLNKASEGLAYLLEEKLNAREITVSIYVLCCHSSLLVFICI